jgi:hypothetical protein
MLCNDNERLLGYRSGEAKALPADPESRKALALSLVADYESLDKSEQDQVEALAPYSTQPLIR